MCESSAPMPLPTDFDLPTEGYLLPSHGLADPECSWLPGHRSDSLHAWHNILSLMLLWASCSTTQLHLQALARCLLVRATGRLTLGAWCRQACCAPVCIAVDEAVDGLQHIACCIIFCCDDCFYLLQVHWDVPFLQTHTHAQHIDSIVTCRLLVALCADEGFLLHTLKSRSSTTQFAFLRSKLVTFSKECICMSAG